MRTLVTGMIPALAYLAWRMHERGDWIVATVLLFAAGVCFEVRATNNESPQP